MRILLFLLLLSLPLQAREAYQIRGLAQFDAEQQSKLKAWLDKAVKASQTALGEYPFTMALHLHPRKANQPVPWANTWRQDQQSVHFYVDTRFPLQRFVNDWTAYHELSHLAIPYLGSWNSWFAEGFASFMQYQLMADAGVLEGSLEDAYRSKIKPQARWYNSQYSAASVARRLMQNRQYAAAYWGGAWFFVLADRQLRQDYGKGLSQLISEYQSCCRNESEDIQQLVTALDAMLEKPVFVPLLQRFEQAPARDIFREWLESGSNE